MPRGGRRQGAPGKAYANRGDLNEKPRKLPATAPTGQAYGAAGAQIAAQRAVPMGTPGPGGGSGGGTPPGGVPPPQPDFARGTERPDEPWTAGLSFGPGPGPEALTLNRGPDPDLVRFRPYLAMLELAASQPDASETTRNLVRRIRAAMPD